MKTSRLTLFVLISLLLSVCSGQEQNPPAPSPSAPNPAISSPSQPTQPTPQASTPAPAPEKSDSTEPADAMARKYVELWNTGKFDNLGSLFSPPVLMVSHGNRIILTEILLRKVITDWRKSMPDLHFEIGDTVIQGNKVAMRLKFTGTYKERLFANTAAPNPAAPRPIRATEMLMFYLKNGKISQIWEEYDEVRMRIMMGGFWRSSQELDQAAAHDSKR